MGDSFFRYLKIDLVHNWESLKILSPHCAPFTRRKGSKVRPDMSINVILNICHSEYLHTQRLKKLVAFGNHICEYILKKEFYPIVDQLPAGRRKGAKTRPEIWLSWNFSLWRIMYWEMVEDQGSGIARSHLFPKDPS